MGYLGTQTPETIRDLWQTPKEVYQFYNKRFGFNVDMASSEANRLCRFYVTAEMDALNYATMDLIFDQLATESQVEPVVWCNPPYSDCRKWVNAVIEYADIFKCPFVMLLPADTSVQWFRTAFENCTECHLITGRISFINADTGKPKGGNNKGSVVFVFDPRSPLKQQVTLIDRELMFKKEQAIG
ncbi:phage N-6-adenine-methyltransferase [Vibrio breoganii]|uniref:Phage N-6-adenine-methyltransferase n=1 Tax=Vibrio breoganii TaxID=553239 RepID=A0AAP8SWN5_9VIBR|nr:phage N-6-adenine-methyltransferase [Vibrio breoganii]PMP10241.1 phage N-6-adenine-methyltransferase [Vibrio breoganii]